ncbi:hypothetical protein G5714_004313 [Onychostoma macrolepis]|uniref:Uncharacterized protein n=1 Tax=Onychostoma macrolepis TaxID=369639 RepID=A0A7J6D4D4_9TELE|nr:hypothetical protein G5714_004313 [Onychostoma macrolepis]
MKFEDKRRISVQQRKKDTGGGQGPPDLSAFDERMAEIIGQSSLSGIIERNEGESDLIQQQLQHEHPETADRNEEAEVQPSTSQSTRYTPSQRRTGAQVLTDELLLHLS